jgi:hypothetical protein
MMNLVKSTKNKKYCPGKRPQTVWGGGRIMYDNVVDDDDGDDEDENGETMM